MRIGAFHMAPPSVGSRSILQMMNNAVSTLLLPNLSLPSLRSSSDYKSHLDGKYMQKFLNKRGSKSKRTWYRPHFADPLDSPGSKSNHQNRDVSEGQLTRACQLGHVLYDKVTHIINTGELSQEITDKQVFITEVKMHPTFGGVNIYWEAKRSDAAQVEKLLQSHSGKLRSLLISYHVFGKIPPIHFVKRKGKSYMEDIDNLLEKADFGPDYVVSDKVFRASRLENKTDQSQQKPVTNFFNRDFRESFREDGNDTRSQSLVEIQGLQLRHNLYGLPVDDLLKKIKAKKEREHAASSDMCSVLDTDGDKDNVKKYATIASSKSNLKRFKESTKVKQRYLERDPEDF